MGFNSAFKGLMKSTFSQYIFEKSPDMKFNGDTSSGSWAVPCGRAGEQTGWRYNFANSPQITRLSGTMMSRILAQQYAMGGGW